MSRYIYIYILLLSVLSCSKELDQGKSSEGNQTLFDQNIQITETVHYLLDLPPKKEFPADIMESINLSKDDGEIKLDLLLFYAADALKEAIKDPEFNQRVIQEARNSPNQTANLIKVTKDLPAVSSMVQENLQRIKSEIEGRIFTEINSLSDIDANLVHAHSSNNINRKYELSLFIPNLESLDPLKQPIISPNISVNEEKNPELEDQYHSMVLQEGRNFDTNHYR